MSKKRVFLGILIVIWMAIIFSAQEAVKSGKTSKGTVRTIMDILPFTREIDMNQKEDIVEMLQPIVRKLAHFSIYTLGGVLIYCFADTFEIKNKFRIMYSILAGFIYSITDELHQYFVPGRSCEIRDICIDTLGIITGVIIVLVIKKIIKRKGDSI